MGKAIRRETTGAAAAGMAASPWLLASAIGNAAGITLIKIAALRGEPLLQSFPWALGAAALALALGMAAYVQALRTTPLSLAYPAITGLSLLFGTAIGLLVFGESLGPAGVVGVGLILCGLVLARDRSGGAPPSRGPGP